MMRKIAFLLLAASLLTHISWGQAINPIIHADVPDLSMIRVGDVYYMSSTTMHMNPGVPIMKSTDLVNWELVGYAYDVLEDDWDELNLDNGQRDYGRGSWASSLRYHEGTYYLSTFSGTTKKTYIYTTEDIEKGPWKKHSFAPSYHDHTLFFEGDKIYLIWGGGELEMMEVKPDLSGIVEGSKRILIENAHAPIKEEIMLPGEGSQLFKVDGKYYLFNIAWPRGGMRTVLIHKADQITGPYEGRIVLQDKGVAQGGLIDTPDGRWFSYLFRDFGAVGRIPYMVPVEWQEDWPVLGVDGKVPMELDLPANKSLIPGIVASDDFKRKKGEPDLPLVWQWNHNPDNKNWEVNGKKGYFRITTGRLDQDILQSRNILTQRTIGPVCAGSTAIDMGKMKEGDRAGLLLLQKRYGWVGVKYDDGKKYLVMESVSDEKPEEQERIEIQQDKLYLKAICDFKDRKDMANFYYSLDGEKWTLIGKELKMAYTLPHFMGYRFGLFNYATKQTGGAVDFDYFHVSDQIKN